MARFFDEGGWSLFDYDFETGRSVWASRDSNGNEVFRIDYPVENVIKANEESYADGLNQRWGEGRRVASIPLNVMYDEKLGLDEAFNVGDEKYINKWLNDGDNAAFRTFPGRV